VLLFALTTHNRNWKLHLYKAPRKSSHLIPSRIPEIVYIHMHACKYMELNSVPLVTIIHCRNCSDEAFHHACRCFHDLFRRNPHENERNVFSVTRCIKSFCWIQALYLPNCLQMGASCLPRELSTNNMNASHAVFSVPSRTSSEFSSFVTSFIWEPTRILSTILASMIYGNSCTRCRKPYPFQFMAFNLFFHQSIHESWW
jgi:hypothetical protein